MSIINLILITLFVVVSVNGKNICYDNYGCFHDSTSLALPSHPSKINTTFYLFNRANNITKELIKVGSLGSFDPKLKTKFVIHGFKHNTSKWWLNSIKDEILEVEDVNVVLVDWSSGNGNPYSLAAGNCQIVGIDVAKLILNLMTIYDCDAKDFHLIGYSLGAHVAGNAGQRIRGLARITALDPSSVYFEDIANSMKLDKSDALFVDVIHTDGSPKLGMGIFKPIGHADFYPNGGKDQPGCPTSDNKIFRAAWTWITDSGKAAKRKFSCSHKQSYNFFIDSIKNKCYTSYSCSDYDSFQQGKCLKCPKDGCQKMGYWASPEYEQGSLYLNTKPSVENDTTKFCKEHYQVRFVSNDLDGMSEAKGKFKIAFKSNNAVSPTVLVQKKGLKLTTNMETVILMDLDEQFSEKIDEVLVSYKRTSNYLIKYLYDQYWSFKYVEVLKGNTQEITKFCPMLQMIKSGTTAIFKKC